MFALVHRLLFPSYAQFRGERYFVSSARIIAALGSLCVWPTAQKGGYRAPIPITPASHRLCLRQSHLHQALLQRTHRRPKVQVGVGSTIVTPISMAPPHWCVATTKSTLTGAMGHLPPACPAITFQCAGYKLSTCRLAPTSSMQRRMTVYASGLMVMRLLTNGTLPHQKPFRLLSSWIRETSRFALSIMKRPNLPRYIS